MAAIGWIVLGLIALIGGAELIVRGGTRVAAILGVPPIVIGLTIVSVGTSAPELAVGIEAASRGNGALASDIPVMVLATLACIPVFWTQRRVTRIEGGLFVAAYLVYLAYLVLVRV